MKMNFPIFHGKFECIFSLISILRSVYFSTKLIFFPKLNFFEKMLKFFRLIHRMLMTEAYTSFENNLRYYGRVVNGEIVEYGSHLPFNFDLISRTNRYTKADVYKEKIEAWLNAMPKAEKIHANWLVSFSTQFFFYICTLFTYEFLFLVGKSRQQTYSKSIQSRPN